MSHKRKYKVYHDECVDWNTWQFKPREDWHYPEPVEIVAYDDVDAAEKVCAMKHDIWFDMRPDVISLPVVSPDGTYRVVHVTPEMEPVFRSHDTELDHPVPEWL